MRKYDPNNLERHIYARGYNLWEWIVAEKGGAPILSGTVKGARHKAVAEASAAMRRLMTS
ncbi:hypothetical protein ACCS61_36020 [Rhizobium ruizarguesonis]